MGCYLAGLYAATHDEIHRVVLMAPAFHFAERWKERVPVGEPLEVYHYGEQKNRLVHYQMLVDASEYPAEPDFHQPALIFHGVGDDVVPIQYSRQFASSHPNSALREMDSDHELVSALGLIIGQAIPFLVG